MIQAGFVVGDNYKKNKIFDKGDKVLNLNDFLLPFRLLQSYLKDFKINLTTHDIKKSYDFLIYNEYRNINYHELGGIKHLYLIIFECEAIKIDNWDLLKHINFNKIFTWNDDFNDKKKYIKFYWPNHIPDAFSLPENNKTHFCSIIAGNKINFHKNELYSERIKAINWFEKNHITEFDLYGIGWDSGIDRLLIRYLKKNYYVHKLLNIILFKLEKIKIIRKIIRQEFKSYKGKLDNKNETLKKYKFSICYENAKGYPGYITEKIFDCFLAGCVPVYLGAPNITDFIPANTFIDKRKYKTYEELYAFMKNMTDKDYSSYLKNIEKFLNSREAKKFSSENFAKTIINEILKDIRSKEKK